MNKVICMGAQHDGKFDRDLDGFNMRYNGIHTPVLVYLLIDFRSNVFVLLEN